MRLNNTSKNSVKYLWIEYRSSDNTSIYLYKLKSESIDFGFEFYSKLMSRAVSDISNNSVVFFVDNFVVLKYFFFCKGLPNCLFVLTFL